MKKKSCLALAMLLCLLQVVTVLIAVPASAAGDVARSYQIAKSTVAPTIDGTVDDIWANYNWSESFVLAKSVAGDFTNENLKAKFKALWVPDAADETKITLYYLVEVAGDVTLHEVDGMKVCLDDGTNWWPGIIRVGSDVTKMDVPSNAGGTYNYAIKTARTTDHTTSKYTVEFSRQVVKSDEIKMDVFIQEGQGWSAYAVYSWNGMVTGGASDAPTGIGLIVETADKVDTSGDVILENDNKVVGSLTTDGEGKVTLPDCKVIGTMVGWKDAAGKVYPVGGTYTVSGTEKVTLTAVPVDFTVLKGASALIEKPTALRFEVSADAADFTALGLTVQETGAVMVETSLLTTAVLEDGQITVAELDAAQIAYNKTVFTEKSENNIYYVLKENITDVSVIHYEGKPCNPSKYMLYSDYFNDYLDYTIKQGAGEKYKGYAEKLRVTAKKSRRYGYVFDTAAKLCDVMEIKYDLGLRTRNAYEAGDKAELKRLAEHEYVEVAKRLRVFAKAFEKQWMTDNKPHGFDVQHMRLGGLLYRTDACRQRILDYVNGKIDRIDELDETLLPYGEKEKSFNLNKAPLTATVNVIHHNHVE